jgi:hypothetical protein
VRHGFCPAPDIPILVSNELFKSLGHPADNATKFFDCDTLQEPKYDLKWLARVNDAVNEHWKFMNSRKSKNTGQFSSPSESLHFGKSGMRARGWTHFADTKTDTKRVENGLIGLSRISLNSQ